MRTPATNPARPGALALLAMCFGTLLAPASATAQSTPADSTDAPPIAAPLGTFRLPLLREGSAILRVEGDLTQDPDERLWLFRPIQPEPGGLRREFALLPCPVLEDMLRTMQLSPAPVEFEMTGRVFIYHGRNFMLPEMAPPIVRFDAAGGTSEGGAADRPTRDTVTAPSGEARFVPTDDDDVVDDIERRLEERIGRAPAPSGSGIASRPTEDRSAREAPVATGTRFVRRAGRLMRDPRTGAWRFVPSQATGRGDASLELMPCQLLERLERDAREGESSPEILLSGTAYAYEGRSYLLPTSFRFVREGRGVSN